METVAHAEQPVKPRRRIVRRVLLTLLALIVLLVAAVWIDTERQNYNRTARELTDYHGVKIGMSRQEVRYVLGDPTHVLGKEIYDKWFKANIQPVYQVDGKDPKNLVPEGTGINDYAEWQISSGTDYWQIDFDKAGAMEMVTYWTSPDNGQGNCDWLFGVDKGDSEDEVVAQLGAPSSHKFID